MGYAELCAISNYTFLRGASFPEELVIRADELGYAAIAITDECSLSGVVRAHMAARERNIQLLVGSEIRLVDGPRLVLLATDRRSYGGLCRLLSKGRRRGEKGSYCLEESDLEDCFPRGCAAIWIPLLVSADSADTVRHGRWLKQIGRAHV